MIQIVVNFLKIDSLTVWKQCSSILACFLERTAHSKMFSANDGTQRVKYKVFGLCNSYFLKF